MFSILNTEEFLLAETEGSEEEDKENDKAEETLNDSALENKVNYYLLSIISFLTVGSNGSAYSQHEQRVPKP